MVVVFRANLPGKRALFSRAEGPEKRFADLMAESIGFEPTVAV
jgi:hypothetical protein